MVRRRKTAGENVEAVRVLPSRMLNPRAVIVKTPKAKRWDKNPTYAIG